MSSVALFILSTSGLPRFEWLPGLLPYHQDIINTTIAFPDL